MHSHSTFEKDVNEVPVSSTFFFFFSPLGLTQKDKPWTVFPSLTSGVAGPEGATPTGKLCMRLNQRTWARETRYLAPLDPESQKTTEA